MDTNKVNIHQAERIGSAALGGTLLLRSLYRGSLGEMAIAAVLLYRGITGHSFLYERLNISTADESKQHGTKLLDKSPEVERSITVEKPADELYRFWRQPQNLSQIMGDFVEITEVGGDRAHWVIQGPRDKRIEWDTQVVEDRPGEMLRWKSVEGAQVPNEVAVSFHPAPRDWGTETTLHFQFDPPGGVLGKTVAKNMGLVPILLADKALHRFKSLAETGEIPTLKHNPSARAEAYAQ